MSALGHKRTFAVQKGMSALPPKADICGRGRRGYAKNCEDAAEKIQSHCRPPACGWPRACGGRESSLSGK